MQSRNKREGQYLAGTVIGMLPGKSAYPNVRAGAGNIAVRIKSKATGVTFVWSAKAWKTQP